MVLKQDVVSFRFANINAWGIKEHYVAALHYCADNDDMDNEIINEELAKWN